PRPRQGARRRGPATPPRRRSRRRAALRRVRQRARRPALRGTGLHARSGRHARDVRAAGLSEGLRGQRVRELNDAALCGRDFPPEGVAAWLRPRPRPAPRRPEPPALPPPDPPVPPPERRGRPEPDRPCGREPDWLESGEGFRPPATSVRWPGASL